MGEAQHTPPLPSNPVAPPVICHVPQYLPTTASFPAGPGRKTSCPCPGEHCSILQYGRTLEAGHPEPWGLGEARLAEDSNAFTLFISTSEGQEASARPDKNLQKCPWLPRRDGERLSPRDPLAEGVGTARDFWWLVERRHPAT